MKPRIKRGRCRFCGCTEKKACRTVERFHLDLVSHELLTDSMTTIFSHTLAKGQTVDIYQGAFVFIGGGWQEDSGDMFFRVLVNGVSPTGKSLDFSSYGSILKPIGRILAPVAIPSFRVCESQTLTVCAWNKRVRVEGQRVAARLIGVCSIRRCALLAGVGPRSGQP